VITCNVADCELYSALRDGESHRVIEEAFFRADGRSFPVEFSIARVIEDDGSMRGAVITFHDITEKRAAALAAETERRYREAEAQNRAKDNFLATLSHELRTPMTSILGWVQFLRTGGYSIEELEEALQTIETSARWQARLIDDMLDVSRIVLGKFHIEMRPTHLSQIVEAAVTTARPDAAERGVRLTSDIEPTEDLVKADGARLQQVIGNILANAIKFTPAGKQVDLQLNRVDGKIRISIRDEGEGIDPTFLPHVFERLQQAEGGTKRSGLGLGLAIARHIVDLHDGEITAESDGVGKGATFTVTLPVIVQHSLFGDGPEATTGAIA
jgi:signal transduction histidine kinase